MNVACVGADWGMQVAEANGLFTVLPEDTPDCSLRNLDKLTDVERVFFLNWSYIVPAEITARYECINFHCTRLPYGRGGHPIENLILRGHTETVITAHRMWEEIDAGPIYARSQPVSLAGSKQEILDRFVIPISDLVRRLITYKAVPFAQDDCPPEQRFRRLPPRVCAAVWKARELGQL